MGLVAKIRATFLVDQPPGNAKFQMASSFNPKHGFEALKAHKWQLRDVHYLVMVPVLLFCLIIMGAPVLFRLAFAGLLALLCLMPITSQFFLHFMPIGVWLILFFCCRYIPPAWRPSIYVRVLPGLESIFYGGNLSAVLASRTNSFFDILAWIPYGLIHFGAPFVVAAICFLFGPPYLARSFGFAFGYMNLIGLFIQILFPNAPPWYQNLYGLQKANYGMAGSAGGLARVDKIIGIDLYSGNFAASPQVFGAFPSLHSGSAVMEALFMSYLFPSFAPLFTAYVLWIWWSTMYLTHHYFVDLIGGAILTLSVYKLTSITIMPRIQYDKFSRWSYDHVEFGAEYTLPKRRNSIVDEESFTLDDEATELSAIPPSAHLVSRTSTNTPLSSMSRSQTPTRSPKLH